MLVVLTSRRVRFWRRYHRLLARVLDCYVRGGAHVAMHRFCRTGFRRALFKVVRGFCHYSPRDPLGPLGCWLLRNSTRLGPNEWCQSLRPYRCNSGAQSQATLQLNQ